MLEESKAAVATISQKALDDFFAKGSNSSNETVVKSFEGGTLTAKRLSLKVVPASGKFTVGAGDGPESPAVEIPKEVLEELGDAVIILTVFNGTELGAESEDGAKTMSAPISIEIFSQSGGYKGPFPANLQIKMPASNDTLHNNESTCAYWNETEKKWLSDGLKTVRRDGEVFCETEHLTLFAMVLMPFEEMVKAFTCSNVGVLSPDKMANMFKGTWYSRSPAIIMYCAVSIYLVALVCAGIFDCRSRKQRRFKDEDFFLEGDEDAQCWLLQIWRDIVQTLILDTIGVIKNADKIKFLVAARDAEDGDEEQEDNTEEELVQSAQGKTVDDNPSLTNAQAQADPQDNPGAVSPNKADARTGERLSPLPVRLIRRFCTCLENHALNFVRFAVVSIMSVQTSVQNDDLRHHIHLSKSPNDVDEDTSSAKKQISTYVLKRVFVGHERMSTQSFKRSNPLRVIWILLLSQQPAHGTFRYSIFISASLQVAILGASLFGPAFLAALFFSASGVTLSIDSPDECSVEKGSAREIIRNILVGFLSWLLTTLPMLLVVYVVKKNFVQRKKWDEASKRRMLRYWNIRNSATYCILVVYSLFCVLFVCAFLANVNPKDEYMWLIAAATVLIEDYVIQPVMIAVLLSTTLAMVVCCRPSVLDKILHELTIPHSSHLFAAHFVLNLSGVHHRQLMGKSSLQLKLKRIIEDCVLDRLNGHEIPRERILTQLLKDSRHESTTYAQVSMALPDASAEMLDVETAFDDSFPSDVCQRVRELFAGKMFSDVIQVEYSVRPSAGGCLQPKEDVAAAEAEEAARTLVKTKSGVCVQAQELDVDPGAHEDNAAEVNVDVDAHLDVSFLRGDAQVNVDEGISDIPELEEFTAGPSGSCMACHACAI
eukprot:TRINITY_DN5534_c0_g1_i4.p1 TRINITY_DN5534_c0_g1~~TRINITY_DN5534_c0_g1_i4.p1  ORF type:complete len:884 (+),score=167.03 TRINITY_DN5534_c0_g1_i4:523-3174(+)